MTAVTTPSHAVGEHPTIWGLDPTRLHDHFWAARGVHVVRQGEPLEVPANAELYLLTDPRNLCIFRLAAVVENYGWMKPQVMFIRLSNSREQGYRETVVTREHHEFVQFRRHYGGSDARLSRVAVTRDRNLALVWRNAPDVRSAWARLRQEVPRLRRDTLGLRGRAYDRSIDGEVASFVRDLVQFWEHPDSTIKGLTQFAAGVWAYGNARVEPSVGFIGRAWVGAGRHLTGDATVLGPASLWDDPAARPANETLHWDEIEPTPALARTIRPRQISSWQQAGKRAFDILFATVVLLLTLPLYPFVMLAIYLEDGWPFFFAHRRETRGGREFPCVKFRSMRKDADRIKRQLAAQNQADGPQFFISDDPRLTRVGRVIRDLNIDELPQFINVLLGHMSVVGPRPSPRHENQYCPPWREARLSVRPGITGLWQVRRTRRKGLDFQEWIKYDIEYVENASWRLDLRIIWETVRLLLKGVVGV